MADLQAKLFAQAVRYMFDHMDQPVTLEQIAEAVASSPSSLKRAFSEATGRSAGSFLRRLRMERAFRTLQTQQMTVLEVALEAGFEDHSAFSRAFRESFGYSPTHARSRVRLISELESVELEEPEMVELSEFSIQAVTCQGLYYEAAPAAWQKLEDRLSRTELGDDFVGTFVGIGHDNPHEGDVAEDQVRFSAGVAHVETDFGLEVISLSAGPYAKFDYVGKLANMGVAYHYIYGGWSETACVDIDAAKPAFMVLDAFPKAADEHRVAIYVPLVRS